MYVCYNMSRFLFSVIAYFVLDEYIKQIYF